MRFFQILSRWQAETGIGFRVQIGDRQFELVEWIVSSRLPRERSDGMFRSALRAVSEIAVPILVRAFENGDTTAAELIKTMGDVVGFHSGLLEYLLSRPEDVPSIPATFGRAFGSFPEEVLMRILDAESTNFGSFLKAVASSTTPAHATLHRRIVARAIKEPLDLSRYRTVAQVLSVHPLEELKEIMQAVLVSGSEDELWLIREVESAVGRLLVDEKGQWLS
jgi:hypothetical protein